MAPVGEDAGKMETKKDLWFDDTFTTLFAFDRILLDGYIEKLRILQQQKHYSSLIVDHFLRTKLFTHCEYFACLSGAR